MNNSTFIGNIGKDAVINTNKDRKAISFNIAVNESYTKDNVKHEKTTWVNCTLWKAADKSTEIAQYLTKGKQVAVTGKVYADAYKNDQSEAVGVLNLQVRDLELLGGKDKE